MQKISESGFSIGKDVAEVKKQLEQLGLWTDFKKLMEPKPIVSLVWLIVNILTITLCIYIFMYSVWTLPIISLVVASRIRAFGNACHEYGGHGNGFKRRRWNLWLSKFFLMPLMWYDAKLYNAEHNDHHGSLSKPCHGKTHACDPDTVDLNWSISNRDSDLVAFFKILAPLLLSWEIYRSSAFGWLFKMGAFARLYAIGWWLALLFLITWITNINVAMSFFIIWIFSRMTWYHLIKVFVELCDHAFMEPTSIIKYTRTMPNNYLSFFLHPENDNYHIAHHLFPKIPMPNLPKAHAILMNVPMYAEGQHLTTYFTGNKSVLKALIGRI